MYFTIALYCFHPNLPLSLQNALEILETNAKYRDDDLNKSRGLAFRRGSAVLKSLPFTVTSVNQVKGLPDIGKHCLAVIQVTVLNVNSRF